MSRELGADATLQRAAWILLSVLLAAVALGLFGRGGPLSDVELAAPDGSLALGYQRFIRYHSPDELTVSVLAQGQETSIWLDAQYAGQIQIERVTPEPAQVVSEGGALRFVFHTTPGARLRATFHFASQHYGPLEGWAAAGRGPRVPIRQLTYP
ncbi:hypothetical protein JN27_07805 [Massilia sp. BSC265]|nr:hypothetical protein JN27_07805 [Massilia sp. BSC265]